MLSKSEPARETLRALNDVLILAEPLLFQLWRSSGLSLGQLRMLRLLRDAPRSPSALAELVGVSAPSATRMLARLEEQGFLERSIDPIDRRRLVIRITVKGRKHLAEHRLWRGTAFEEAVHLMTPGERKSFVAVLSAFAQRVRKTSEIGGAGGLQPVIPVGSASALDRR